MKPGKQTIGALEAALYDAFMAQEQPGDEQLFYEELLHAGGEAGAVLELGCGAARVALNLARRGMVVHGLDCSEAMLEMARVRAGRTERAGRQLTALELICARMEEYQASSQYVGIYAAGFSFFLLTELEAARATLRRCLENLRPQGVLLLTGYWPWEFDENALSTPWELYAELNGSALKQALCGSPWQESGGVRARCSTRSESNIKESLLTRWHRYELFDARGALIAEEESRLAQRIWRPEDLGQVLQESGFGDIWVFSGFSAEPYEEGDSLWTICARKS